MNYAPAEGIRSSLERPLLPAPSLSGDSPFPIVHSRQTARAKDYDRARTRCDKDCSLHLDRSFYPFPRITDEIQIDRDLPENDFAADEKETKILNLLTHSSVRNIQYGSDTAC